MTLRLSALDFRCILLDIEGTTTPIAFVHEVLFPFARKHVRDYLASNAASDSVRTCLDLLRAEHVRDVAQALGPPALTDSSDSIVSYIHWLIDRDRKSTGLKSLQGKIWEAGYRDGSLKSEVFPDVPPALERWHGAGLRIAIFSSGSVLAQKLLFTHTSAGDLTRFIDGYFDTTSGAKNAAESYRRIAAALQLNPAQFLFISDVGAELDAADDAGMGTVMSFRPGNPAPAAKPGRAAIKSFDEIDE